MEQLPSKEPSDSEQKPVKKEVPIREGYFHQATSPSEESYLIGSRCKSCGQVSFPKREHCLECFGQDMERVILRGNCKLYTFTIVHMPTEHYDPPYAIGWVEFPEGVRVFGQIKGWESQPLKIGMKMKVVIDTLWQEVEKEVIGYKFEPL